MLVSFDLYYPINVLVVQWLFFALYFVFWIITLSLVYITRWVMLISSRHTSQNSAERFFFLQITEWRNKTKTIWLVILLLVNINGHYICVHVGLWIFIFLYASYSLYESDYRTTYSFFLINTSWKKIFLLETTTY